MDFPASGDSARSSVLNFANIHFVMRFLSALIIAPLLAQVNPPSARTTELATLPIQRVVLFKNGVGYFEHLGKVRDRQEVTISFTSGQLNDALKSLTLLDLNGGRIGSVNYGSSASTDKQLGNLRLPVSEKPTLAEFLGAFRGARIEARSGATVITGRLLSIERKTRISGGTTLEVDYLAVIADNGDVRTTELTPSFSVRLLDKALSGKVEQFLDIASTNWAADSRRVVITAEGTGERSLFVSYISEVPVWKSTYRIILPSKAGQNPMLQGWAIVDNTTGEDWNKVQLSLMAGAPQSFIQNLSQPFYSHRPVVNLQESFNAKPQTFESTLIPGGARIGGMVTDPNGAAIAGARVKAFDIMGNPISEALTGATGSYVLASLPNNPLRLEVELPGFQKSVAAGVVASTSPTVQNFVLQLGSTSQTMTVTADASTIQTSSAARASTGNAGRGSALGSGAALGGGTRGAAGVGGGYGGGVGGGVYSTLPAVTATAQQLGDLFEYKIKDPVTLRKDQSALMPIVQSPVAVEKVSIWNEQSGQLRPQRALWLTNSSNLTLDGGNFSVLEDEIFAGEGLLDPLRPGEKRLLSYAADLGVTVSSKIGNEKGTVSRVRIANGILTIENEQRETKTYTFRNEDQKPRTLIVEHPVRSGFMLRSELKPTETTSNWMRFRVPVAAKETASLVVDEARPMPATFQISNLQSDQVALFVREQSISKDIEDALRHVLALKTTLNRLEEKKSGQEQEKDKIYDDQQRLRENIKALKGSAEEKALIQRYTQQLNEQENRLGELEKAIAQSEAQINSAAAAVDQAIQALAFDRKL